MSATLANEGVEVDHARLGIAAPAELEDLPRDGRGLEPGAMDLIEVLARGGLLRELRAHDFAVAVDDGEQVVEVAPPHRRAGRPCRVLRVEQGLALQPQLGLVLIDHDHGTSGALQRTVFPTGVELSPVFPRKPAARPVPRPVPYRPSIGLGGGAPRRCAGAMEDPGVAALQAGRRIAGQLCRIRGWRKRSWRRLSPSSAVSTAGTGSAATNGLEGPAAGRVCWALRQEATLDDPVAAVFAPITGVDRATGCGDLPNSTVTGDNR